MSQAKKILISKLETETKIIAQREKELSDANTLVASLKSYIKYKESIIESLNAALLILDKNFE